MAWILNKEIQGTDQIFLVADVMGSGKTALAHTIAKHCFEADLLTSSFFFNKNSRRLQPRDFVFKTARDIGARFPEVADHIATVLQGDPRLMHFLPTPLLFERLVLEPLTQKNVSGPIVIIIDALNEAKTSEMYGILRNQLCSLPGIMRVFVTSRVDQEILHNLGPEIRLHDLAIHDSGNHHDMASFVHSQLTRMAELRSIEGWPDQNTIDSLVGRAEGLFIWITTICDYLSSRMRPDEELAELLDHTREGQLPPELKMDFLYAAILKRCQWGDRNFSSGYEAIMGMMILQQQPLTVETLQEIRPIKLPAKTILIQLAPLVTGLLDASATPQLLHSSCREYLTQRTKGPWAINLQTHHRPLAIIFLHLVAEMLTPSLMQTCIYAEDWFPLAYDDADEQLHAFKEIHWYAVNFWIAHLICWEEMIPEWTVNHFLKKHLTHWIEFVVSKLEYQSLVPLYQYIQKFRPESSPGIEVWIKPTQCLLRILPRLVQDERLREAQVVAADLEHLTHMLEAVNLEEFNFRTLLYIPWDPRCVAENRGSQKMRITADLEDFERVLHHHFPDAD
ncbi:hypothetical protein FB45DRAFT_803075 [Roridomyces roridus]|uniref:Nephrocystin 3-like N-terminal domain-containing protein n=1 Tax=Roridomyces roridus TaxID=1738132 RepID=A0AAD7B8E9_9AGAR|nr:hypothetical protein FB45DRAFT_803075 [Roridomyces roridus]